MTSPDKEMLTIALPKGKLFQPSADLLARFGYTAEGLAENSRKLVIVNEAKKIQFVITKPMDLPTYVEYGAADIGIIGKDVLLEEVCLFSALPTPTGPLNIHAEENEVRRFPIDRIGNAAELMVK